MAGPSEAKAHCQNHAPRRLVAAPGGSQTSGVGGCMRLRRAWAGHVQEISGSLFCCYRGNWVAFAHTHTPVGVCSISDSYFELEQHAANVLLLFKGIR